MLSRRQFLNSSGAAGAALVLAPQSAIEALAAPRGAGSVRLEVAGDAGFRRVVARKTIATSARRGYSVKARVGGLRPNERYWYRFETRDEQSPAGRFQTALPEDSNQPVRLAFFSCAEYTAW